MNDFPAQEIHSYQQAIAISKIKQCGLDPLQAYYAWASFINTVIELHDVSWDVRRELLQYLAIHQDRLHQEVDRFLNHPLCLAIKSGNLEAIERCKDLSLIDQEYRLIQFLVKWVNFYDDETPLKILQLLKKNGATITEEAIFHALSSHSAEFIAELCQDQSIAWTPETAFNCATIVRVRSEPLIWETLKSGGWPFKAIEGILTLAIEAKNLPFVQWLLREGVKEEDEERVWECGDLEIVELFFPLKTIVERLHTFPRLLQNFFLFSRLEKIQAYFKQEKLYQEYLCYSALIARQSSGRVHHVQNQMEFGALCHQAVLEKLEDFREGETDLLLAIQRFSKARHQIAALRSEGNEENFLQLRTFIPNELTFTSFAGRSSRYSFALPWMKKMMQRANSEEFEKDSNGYTLYYWDPKTQKRYPLTKVNLEGRLWIHTELEPLLALWPVLQSMHEEVLAMHIDKGDPSQMRHFQEKVAKAYWLGCNLMITSRGNAQYFLMWLSTLLQYRGFSPLLAKRETPMPDCLAISLPMTEFITVFPTLYENPLGD